MAKHYAAPQMADAGRASGAESLQRRRIYRWVAAVGLLATAEELQGVDVPETNAMGLMGAHAACEAMLGLLAGNIPYVQGKPKEPPFPMVLELAAGKARPRLTQTLRSELMAMHSVRNAFVHGGSTVDSHALDAAIDAAHALATHVPLPGHDRLVGVPTVVAAIINIEAIGIWLRHADEQRLKGNLRYSADSMARALDAALDRTVPRVRTRTGRSMMQTIQRMADISAGQAISRPFEELGEALDQLTRWVYPLALGASPATVDYIREVVGTQRRMDMGGAPNPVDRPTDEAPSLAHLRRASSLASRVILRLSIMGVLAPRRGDDQIVELANEALRDPEMAKRLELPPP
jgi:hypothetical protein